MWIFFHWNTIIKRGLKGSRGGWQLREGEEFHGNHVLRENYVIDDVVENHEEWGELRMKGLDWTKAWLGRMDWQIGWAQGVPDDGKVGEKLVNDSL